MFLFCQEPLEIKNKKEKIMKKETKIQVSIGLDFFPDERFTKKEVFYNLNEAYKYLVEKYFETIELQNSSDLGDEIQKSDIWFGMRFANNMEDFESYDNIHAISFSRDYGLEYITPSFRKEIGCDLESFELGYEETLGIIYGFAEALEQLNMI